MASPHYKCFQTLLRSSHVIGIWNYIEGIRFTVSDLAKRVIKTQENVITIEHTMKTWKSAGSLPPFTASGKSNCVTAAEPELSHPCA